MKKTLMLIAGIASMLSASAASVDWQFSETAQTSKNPLDISGYTAYLFTASTWTSLSSAASAGTLAKDDFKGWTDSASLTTTSMGGGAGVKYDTGLQTATGDSGTYYIVLADDSSMIVSSALTATSYEDATSQHDTAKWTILASNNPVTNASYSFSPVPEPTSGLLLLIGVAGLALKRKRA